MFQVRIHGRGGQGVVTAAEILSVAAFLEGKNAQAFPTFGSERMGAPVTAFCRIDDKPIRLREPVVAPDALIIQDATLLHRVPLFDGLAASGFVLVNTPKTFQELELGLIGDTLMPGPLPYSTGNETGLRLRGAAYSQRCPPRRIRGVVGHFKNRIRYRSNHDEILQNHWREECSGRTRCLRNCEERRGRPCVSKPKHHVR